MKKYIIIIEKYRFTGIKCASSNHSTVLCDCCTLSGFSSRFCSSMFLDSTTCGRVFHIRVVRMSSLATLVFHWQFTDLLEFKFPAYSVTRLERGVYTGQSCRLSLLCMPMSVGPVSSVFPYNRGCQIHLRAL